MRYSRPAVALGCSVLVSCTTGATFDRQVLQTRDASNSGIAYFTNRDVGASARLSGRNTSGVTQTRDLWVFGDSGGWESDGTPFVGTFGFPTNSGSLVEPKALGSNPPVNPMPSAVVRNAPGRPDAFVALISGGAGYPACNSAAGEYAAQWPSAVIRLPDNETRRETALVFYQNWCVDLDPLAYRAFDGGVAAVTWDADAPDAPPTATVLNDRLFAPGRFISQWIPNGLEKAGSYGQAPYFKPGSANELIVLQCGNASHCTTARWFYDPTKTPQQNLDSVKARASWRYRVEGPSSSHADDQWIAFPPVDANPDDDCTPTSDEACGAAYPVAKRVLTASSDLLSQVWGAPSITITGTSLIIAYMPGPPDHSNFKLDHAAVRLSTADGIFGGPVRANLPPGQCAGGCYAPAFHPELNHDSWLYFSYFAPDTVTMPNGAKVGSLRIGRSCANAFNGGTCP